MKISAPERTTPDGGQRSPNLTELLASTTSVARRVPGMVRTTWKYLRRDDHLQQTFHECTGPATDAPDADRPLPGPESTILRRSHGRGPLYRRVYRGQVAGSRTGPEELISRLLTDPNRASPTEVSWFEAAGGREVGDEFAVRMPGPWDAPVRIVERTPTSFRFVTLRGHMEAGEISFSAAWGDGGRLVVEIESWARSGDRLYDLIYTCVPLAREMQRHMWVHVLERAAVMAGGELEDGVEVTTWRWKRG